MFRRQKRLQTLKMLHKEQTMKTARKQKIETVKQLIYGTAVRLTKEELDFMQKHAYKQQAFMFVFKEEDKRKAQNILHRLKDTQTIVMLISEEDLKL